MKKIAVFFEQPNFDDYPFDEEEYRDAYHEFAKIIARRGGEFFIVRGDTSYLGKMKFRAGWKWDGAKFAEVGGEFAVDVIYDKSNSALTPPFRFESEAKILNPNPIVEICNDKFKTHTLFPEFSPRITIALDEAQVVTATRETRGKRMVLKPLNAEGGAGVVIGDAEKLRSAKKDFPVLISEFIDTSEGIPKVAGIDSHHDFRMVVIDGEIIQSFARTPPTGSLTANVAQGGASHEIALTDIPATARELAEKVDAKFASYRRVYSIDLGFDENGEPKLIELNSQPALFSQKRGASFTKFQKKVADVLLSF
ncbi:ATP-grasp domain-containing protein [Candidatus Gracilibacteria bacterium]|nr:ATP-grasp domain-containing protein [Candidatus Gracilibacteria bacterium]MCF7856073.1 ATP-grasp domain-containing protein [Candidatus Gracilibacteria bacterium]MCF7896492.1 ATP-grasp domain-containing protein [Candidatus Gracilibacteria bacterium]